MEWLGDAVKATEDLDGVWLYVAAFLLGFGEGAMFADLVVPGEVGMVLVGVAVSEGPDPIVAVIVVGAAGAFLGDTASYALGRTAGTAIVTKWSWARRHIGPRIKRSEAFFERHGGPAVFAARWVGGLRAVVPFVAGTSHFPYSRFVVWDGPACLLWTSTVIALGATVGPEIADFVDTIGTIASITVVIGLGAGCVAWRRRRQRHRV